MKKLNIYFDCEFTSLSPDAQLISIGMVTDDIVELDKGIFVEPNNNTKDRIDTASKIHPSKITKLNSKSFYAEFTDFDVNHCDDWVKENVVGKLKYRDLLEIKEGFSHDLNNISIPGNTENLKKALAEWLSQFSDYEIQFVADCGSFDWYHLLNLIAIWEEKKELVFSDGEHQIKNIFARHEEELKLFQKANGREVQHISSRPTITNWLKGGNYTVLAALNGGYYILTKIGLPKLPGNISHVPQDLNDLILYKHLNRVSSLFTAKDAFNANRETLMYLLDGNKQNNELYEVVDNTYTLKENGKHNALFDAKVIKAIYNNLR